MYRGKTLAAVVPAYNEETQIARVVTTMPDYVDHIVIIDDKSRDRTADTVRRLAEANPKVVLIAHTENQGVGGAIASGYKWARDHDLDLAVVMAGDGQMDPADLPALCDPLVDDEVDYVKGNRLVHDDAYRMMPKIRFYGNAALSFLTKFASGYWHVADSQTGYAVIGRRALNRINWDAMYKRYGQPNDLLVKLNAEDLKVRDVPIRPVYNVGEVSGIKVRRVLFTISLLLFKGYAWRLWKKYLVRDAHPLVLFILMGCGLMLCGGLFMVRLLVLWAIQGAMPEVTLIIMLFCFTLGLQSFLFGVWMDMDRNRHLR